MNQLLDLITAPLEPREIGSPKLWEKVESRLGLQLPPDYKSLIDAYGTGTFDDFIIVYNPFAQNEYLNLFFALDMLHQADQQTKSLGDSTWTAVHPFDLYPAPDGLLPWGCTTIYGDIFFWKIDGPPETWETIFYNLRSGEYEVWKNTLTEFLYLLFTHQIQSVLLPEDYPSSIGAINFVPFV